MADTTARVPIGGLAAARIFTRSLAQSRAFYADVLGLRVCGGDVMDGFILFDTGATATILEAVDHDDPEARDLVGRFLGLSFSVADLHAAYRSLLARGVVFDAGPERQPWGGWLAHLRDPDDHILTLVQ